MLSSSDGSSIVRTLEEMSVSQCGCRWTFVRQQFWQRFFNNLVATMPARSVCLVFVRQWIYQTKFTETNFSLYFKLWLRSWLSFPPWLHRGVSQWILSMNKGEETILQNWRFWLKFWMQNPEKWELDLQRTNAAPHMMDRVKVKVVKKFPLRPPRCI